jgi:hypothetical protein
LALVLNMRLSSLPPNLRLLRGVLLGLLPTEDARAEGTGEAAGCALDAARCTLVAAAAMLVPAAAGKGALAVVPAHRSVACIINNQEPQQLEYWPCRMCSLACLTLL